MTTHHEEPTPEAPLNQQSKIFAIIAVSAIFALILFILFGLKTPPPQAPSIEYNYFNFTQNEGLWETIVELNGQPILATFRYNPEQVADVPLSGTKVALKQPIYLTFDPESPQETYKYLALANTELALHLIRAFNTSVESACTKNVTEACADRPIIDCTTKNASVIKLIPTPPAQITLQDNCVILSGQDLDLLKSVDRLLFKWYNIMK